MGMRRGDVTGMRRSVPLLVWAALGVFLASGIALMAMLAVPQEARAAFPGQNGRIVFYKSVNGNQPDIYTVLPDGSGLKQITTSGIADVDPVWSPDGTKIAFGRNATRIHNDIFVKNVRNGNVTRLTNSSHFDSEPAWSPDGSKIVFSSERTGSTDGRNDIWVMNADGTNQVRLTTDAAYEDQPVWSPDGTKIAFRKDSEDIWVTNADGTQPTNIYDTEHVCCTDGSPEDPVFAGDPNWSPDGTKIAFDGGYYVAEGGGYTHDIYVMNADGSGHLNLTNTPDRTEAHPSWSPNGNKIAFALSTASGNDIVKMDADGTDREDVTTTPREGEWVPDWGSKPVTPR